MIQVLHFLEIRQTCACEHVEALYDTISIIVLDFTHGVK
jgi:hypothetical protein